MTGRIVLRIVGNALLLYLIIFCLIWSPFKLLDVRINCWCLLSFLSCDFVRISFLSFNNLNSRLRAMNNAEGAL